MEQIIEDNRYPPNPVHTKVLTNVMMGAPQPVYHGGLLRATVRYFDPDNARPGIPRDVAALVDRLEADRVGLRLVNLDPAAGAPGGGPGRRLRPSTTSPEVRVEAGESTQVTMVDGRHFTVDMRPSSAIRLDAGMRRFVNAPSHAFPLAPRPDSRALPVEGAPARPSPAAAGQGRPPDPGLARPARRRVDYPWHEETLPRLALGRCHRRRPPPLAANHPSPARPRPALRPARGHRATGGPQRLLPQSKVPSS